VESRLGEKSCSNNKGTSSYRRNALMMLAEIQQVKMIYIPAVIELSQP
jgi:hypothetical protein